MADTPTKPDASPAAAKAATPDVASKTPAPTGVAPTIPAPGVVAAAPVPEKPLPTADELFQAKAKEICQSVLNETLKTELTEFRETVRGKIKALLLEVLDEESKKLIKPAAKKAA